MGCIAKKHDCDQWPSLAGFGSHMVVLTHWRPRQSHGTVCRVAGSSKEASVRNVWGWKSDGQVGGNTRILENMANHVPITQDDAGTRHRHSEHCVEGTCPVTLIRFIVTQGNGWRRFEWSGCKYFLYYFVILSHHTHHVHCAVYYAHGSTGA